MEESLDVGPDLVGFCPRESLEDPFAPGEATKNILTFMPILQHNN